MSNEAYCLFVAIKNTINGMLQKHLCSTSIATLNDEEDGHTKQTIVEMICEDDVLFQWTLLGMDEDPTSYDMELLNHIITLWLTIRGHSVSKCWMERYKQTEATIDAAYNGMCTEKKIYIYLRVWNSYNNYFQPSLQIAALAVFLPLGKGSIINF